MIYLLPSAQKLLNNHREPAEFVSELSAVVEPTRFMRTFFDESLPFEGTVQEDEFEIRRINSWSNMTGVVADGKIKASINDSSTELEVIFSIDKRYYFKLLLFLVLMGLTRFRELQTPEGRPQALIFLLSVFGIYAVILIFVFNFEVRKISNLLEEL